MTASTETTTDLETLFGNHSAFICVRLIDSDGYTRCHPVEMTEQAAELVSRAGRVNVYVGLPMRRSGSGPRCRKIGQRSVRYSPEDLTEFVRSGIRSSTSDRGA